MLVKQNIRYKVSRKLITVGKTGAVCGGERNASQDLTRSASEASLQASNGGKEGKIRLGASGPDQSQR